MVRRSLSLAAVAALGLGLACQEEQDRPPPAPPCMGSNCVPPIGAGPRPNGGAPNGEGGEGGSDGEGASGGEGGTANGTLTGTVREFVDLALENTVLFTSSATLSVRTESGRTETVRWNGVDPFVLTGLPSNDVAWVLVTPTVDRAVLPTLHPVPMRERTEADLGLIRSGSFDVVLLLLTIPGERASGRAQLILRFVDPASVAGGEAGVRVALPDAEFISYGSEGGGWSELEAETDVSGLVVLGNIVAPPFPGSTKRITLSGSRTGAVDVRLVADAVSLVEVAPPEP
jgi:hypothetical protein